jgi:hypothetical protein
MAKIAGYIALVCLLSCIVRGQPIGSDRNIVYNVIPKDIIKDTISVEPSIRDKVADTLISYLYVKELTGNNDGQEVEMFIESTGLNPKGNYPWCAAFISYVFQANKLSVPKYSARAAIWFDEKHTIPNRDAIKADLASLYYNRLGRIGHIMMYLQPYINPTPYVAMGEGNTNAQGSNEGNRAAKNFRPRAIIHSSSNWID